MIKSRYRRLYWWRWDVVCLLFHKYEDQLDEGSFLLGFIRDI